MQLNPPSVGVDIHEYVGAVVFVNLDPPLVRYSSHSILFYEMNLHQAANTGDIPALVFN